MDDDDRIDDIDGNLCICGKCGEPCTVGDDGLARHIDPDHDEDHVPVTDMDAVEDHDRRAGLYGPEHDGEDS